MRLLIAPGVWLAHFTFAYVMVSLVCSAGGAGREVLGVAVVPLAVGVATLAACTLFAVQGYVDYRRWRAHEAGTRGFISIVSVLLCGLSALGVLWVAFPAFVLPPCAA